MSDGTPVGFLDVDGVVSPFGVGTTWPDAHLYPGRPSDLTVPYRRHVVDTIARLHTQHVVEVQWLTTWDDYLLTAWEEVGLGPFEVALQADGRRHWWKANTVAQWLTDNPGRRAVWTDDDITPSRLRGFDKHRLYAITPDHRVGLTDEHLARIERWAQGTPVDPSRIERESRGLRVSEAIASGRLEGVEPSAEFLADAALYVGGDIDDDELIARARQRWGLE